MSTVLTVDIGNTDICTAVFTDGLFRCSFRIPTAQSNDVSYLKMYFEQQLLLQQLRFGDIEGSIISSVVPSALRHLFDAIFSWTDKKPVVAGPQLSCQLDFSLYDKKRLGADRIADAAGAAARYGTPCVIFDLGTASTMSVIDGHNRFLGGAIAPGIQMSLSALHACTAQLPLVSLRTPQSVIGSDTDSCIRSGVIFGLACMLDGMYAHVKEALHTDQLTGVVTGGRMPFVRPLCRMPFHFDPDLMLYGLLALYEQNKNP